MTRSPASTESLFASVEPHLAPMEPLLAPKESTNEKQQQHNWGRRSHHGSWLHSLGCAGIMILCPLLVSFYSICLTHFGGSMSAARHRVQEIGILRFTEDYGPRPDVKAGLFYCAWLVFQAALYQFLPSKISIGQLTPAGNLLKYRTNGLLAWAVTHALYGLLVWKAGLDPAIVAHNWTGLLIAANIYGFLLTVFAYVKACHNPTHDADLKFSGSLLYDMYMGVELNPRLGKYFDFKLFHNGRPGIIAWTLINFSFIAYQRELHGIITNSIIVSSILQSIYVVDFFINEDWYLRTIDICHDHFGFYLAWGSMVWLPGMYTLQAQYLARNPIVLPPTHAVGILLTGISGYALFRSVNHQKDLVRRTQGACTIWGSKAKVLHVKYHTKNGMEHSSILLCSGWWGMARHVNYLGDLVLSYSMCATCGFKNLLPWTYAIFMTILLIHRSWRDEERCSKKYGKDWDLYCKEVRWCLIPGVY